MSRYLALTVRLVPGCGGVYPWLQLPCALATQNLAGGVRCFQRGFHKFFCRLSSPAVSHTLLFPFLCLALSLSSGLSVGLGS